MIIDTVNSELVNVFGNLVNRTVAMINKYFNGTVKDYKLEESFDVELKTLATSLVEKVSAKMEEFRVSDALTEIFTLFRRANKYIDETMPWVLAKDESKKERLSTVLYNLSEAIIIGASLLSSFIPDTAKKTVKAFNVNIREFDKLKEFSVDDEITVEVAPEKLFDRIDGVEMMKKVNAMIEERKAMEIKKEEVKKESKPLIDFADFEKIELRIAKVIAAEKVEKSKKLLKLTVKLGDEERTVVSGIANHYAPEDLIGKKLTMVTNLKPAKLCGIMSEGMIICAEDNDGKIAFLSPEKDIEDGSQVF
jgi:methionyl-tRNA synthetase